VAPARRRILLARFHRGAGRDPGDALPRGTQDRDRGKNRQPRAARRRDGGRDMRMALAGSRREPRGAMAVRGLADRQRRVARDRLAAGPRRARGLVGRVRRGVLVEGDRLGALDYGVLPGSKNLVRPRSWKIDMQIGLIQTRGIGDIIIALPIAKHLVDQGHTVVWPIYAPYVRPFQEAAPYVEFLPLAG